MLKTVPTDSRRPRARDAWRPHRPGRGGPGALIPGVAVAGLAACLGGCAPAESSPAVLDDPGVAAPLSPGEELETFRLPDGYRMELVASEPDVVAPVAIDFDADGRMYVVEMRGYMPNVAGEREKEPVGRVVVLEDTDWDGRMDRHTVFLDSLVLPRTVKVLDRGVLVGTPPNLWLARDTDGDLRADERELVRQDFGDPQRNAEKAANGLLWGLDNWIHNSWYEGQIRLRPGGFEYRYTPTAGQWGVSSDDFGRLFRNNNANPLRVDYLSAHYYARNPGLTRTTGRYEEVTPNGPVWSARNNQGVTFGYSDKEIRPDGRLTQFTAAGSPTVYRGDRLPAEMRGDVLVAEPGGNLVRRFVVTETEEGRLQAENAYEQAEFITSTDERFRPVFLFNAPDGTLYLVDMYRGIIEHRDYITPFLEKHIVDRGLEEPLDRGRIWRIVHESTRRDGRPDLSRRTPADLVPVLAHPNAWWRETAQRLLVERGDSAVAPALRARVREGADERARLHALWTLEGLAAADPATLRAALRDPSMHVRAAAIRIAEPWLARPEHPLQGEVLRQMDDRSPTIRRQLTASLGELHPDRREAALAEMLDRYGDDRIVVDLVVSGLRGLEMSMLERLLSRSRVVGHADAVRLLAASVFQAGEPAARRRLLSRVADEARPREERLALLEGIRRVLPARPRTADYAPLLEIVERPEGLIDAAASGDTAVAARAAAIVAGLSWPGKPEDPDRSRPRPLSDEEQARFAAGEVVYSNNCAACHQADGQGEEGIAKPLAGSPWVNGVPGRLARILLHGKEGETLMPPLGKTMSDEEIAAVLTYVRRAWGNRGLPVEAEFVTDVRGSESAREMPWSEPELLEVRR